MTDSYKSLFYELSTSEASYAGDLAGMAYIAHELLKQARDSNIVESSRGRTVIATMERTLMEYYQGKGKNSIIASKYANLKFNRDYQCLEVV